MTREEAKREMLFAKREVMADSWIDKAYDVAIKALEQPEQTESCELCSSLEKGDTLYQLSEWDGGIGFDYIRNIQYCPMCGRRLKK